MKSSFEGQRFGEWAVLIDDGLRSSSGQRMVIAVCTCGTRREVRLSHLLEGRSQSCHGRQTAKRTHGHTTTLATGKRKRSPEHTAWSALKQRCLNPRNPRFAKYGGRGITVCTRWVLSFEHFLEDMGPRPSARHSIDRYPDNDGPYAPGNCRWATSSQQNLNRPNRKLSTADIRSIKASRDSARLAGLRFGVSKATVKDIRRGRLHRDVA